MSAAKQNAVVSIDGHLRRTGGDEEPWTVVRASSEIRLIIERVQQEKATIRASIDMAKRTAAATGVYGDRAWLVSAERAERQKGFAISSLQIELGKANKAERQQKAKDETKTFERAFLQQAKAILPDSLYMEIIRSTAEATGRQT